MSCQSSFADANGHFGLNSHTSALRISLEANMSVFDFLINVMPTGEQEVAYHAMESQLGFNNLNFTLGNI